MPALSLFSFTKRPECKIYHLSRNLATRNTELRCKQRYLDTQRILIKYAPTTVQVPPLHMG
jgi:hypothetical protein